MEGAQTLKPSFSHYGKFFGFQGILALNIYKWKDCRLGYRKFKVTSDEVGSVVQQNYGLKKKFNFISFTHVFRELNMIADRFSKKGSILVTSSLCVSLPI